MHQGASVWVNVHALPAVSPLIRKTWSMLLIFKISNHKEYEMLKDKYSHLVGKDEFEIYKMAVGKRSKPYSFLTILPHEQDESKMFLARMDQRLSVDSASDED